MTRQLVAALIVLALAALVWLVGALSERVAAQWDDVVDEDADCPECGANLAEGDWHDRTCTIGWEATQDRADEAAADAARDERFDR